MSNTSRRCIFALAACLLLIAAAPAAAAPTASFSVDPAQPRCRDAATYTSTSTVDDPLLTIAKVEWDWNNDGTYDEEDTTAPFTTTHTFNTRGSRLVGIKATDSDPLAAEFDEAAQPVNVVTAAPEAKFTSSDRTPVVGSDVLFASNPTDPDGDQITAWAWDFDDDGETDSTDPDPVHRFTETGPHLVSLRVTDSCGATSPPAELEVDVQGVPVPGNNLPVASFVFSPRTAQVGDPVTFVSSSFDTDGPLRDQRWDLDGDGQFDDGAGAEVVYTYNTPGSRAVRLLATDSAGASAVRVGAINVVARPKPPPGYLRPAPHVRFNGVILPNGARIQILSVRAPRGSVVAVRCKAKGKRCPAKLRRKRVKKRVVRFKTFERFLRAGTRLEIYVRKANTIGAFTRYVIRAGKGPVRVDRCLPAGASTKPRRRCG